MKTFIFISVTWLLVSDVFASELVLYKENNQQLTEQQHRLANIYESIGLDIKYQVLPTNRGIRNAETGQIDGLFGVPNKFVRSSKNLVRIKVPIHLSKLVLVINKLKCETCDADSIESLCAVRATKYSEMMTNLDVQHKLTTLHSHHDLLSFFKAGRSDAMLINSAYLPAEFKNEKAYSIVYIGDEPLFHYLHVKNRDLVEQLEQELRRSNKETAATRGSSTSDEQSASSVVQ